MTVVVDASMVAAWLLPDEKTEATDAVLEALDATLSRSHGLTAYDAAYLALAIETSLPLATLDRARAIAARARGVALLGPLAP